MTEDACSRLTAEEFERQYAARCRQTVEQLRALGRTVRPCHCNWDGCEGWQSISLERAAEFDQHARDGTLPPQLW